MLENFQGTPEARSRLCVCRASFLMTFATGGVPHASSWQRSAIQSAKTRLGVDCGSGHELLIAKSRLKLKKVGKTTRPFRYDLNQIRYDYTVEMRNRFKGLDLVDRVPVNYGQKFVTLYSRQESRPSPRKRNAKKQNGCLGRPYK